MDGLAIHKWFMMSLLCLPHISYATQMDNLRGVRYCEIILAKTRLNFSIYSTTGINQCPDEAWSNVSQAAIKRETGSFFVYLNGPQYLLMDGIKHAQLPDSKYNVLGGIHMREMGTLHITLSDIVVGSAPYHGHQIDRQMISIYKTANPIYELISPKGDVFVMQSHHIEKNSVTHERLAKLGAELKLPKGWQFKTGLLESEIRLDAINNKTVILQDDLLNTYQLATHDFLG